MRIYENEDVEENKWKYIRVYSLNVVYFLCSHIKEKGMLLSSHFRSIDLVR